MYTWGAWYERTRNLLWQCESPGPAREWSLLTDSSLKYTSWYLHVPPHRILALRHRIVSFQHSLQNLHTPVSTIPHIQGPTWSQPAPFVSWQLVFENVSSPQDTTFHFAKDPLTRNGQIGHSAGHCSRTGILYYKRWRLLRGKESWYLPQAHCLSSRLNNRWGMPSPPPSGLRKKRRGLSGILSWCYRSSAQVSPKYTSMSGLKFFWSTHASSLGVSFHCS